MVDAVKVKMLIERRKSLHMNWPWLDRDFFTPLVDAMGDDEQDIISFIKAADDETRSAISGITEELFAKFPSDAMGELIDNTWQMK